MFLFFSLLVSVSNILKIVTNFYYHFAMQMPKANWLPRIKWIRKPVDLKFYGIKSFYDKMNRLFAYLSPCVEKTKNVNSFYMSFYYFGFVRRS